MTFKSTPSTLFVSFLKTAFVIFFVMLLILLTANEGKDAAVYALIAAAVAIAGGALCVMLFWNIAVTVTDSEVVFTRRGKAYLRFPFGEYRFSSFVVINRYNYIPVSVSRKLRVFPAGGGAYKDYKCHNFSKGAFEELIAYADLCRNKYDAPPEEAAVSPEKAEFGFPLEFSVDRAAHIAECRKMLLTGVIVCAVLFAVMLVIGIAGNFIPFIIAVSVVILLLLIPAFVLPYLKAGKTPESVGLTEDGVFIGGDSFRYDDISRIKMTPPGYDRNEADLGFNEQRMIKIVCGGNTYAFYLGMKKSKRLKNGHDSFPDYADFYNAVKAVFSSRARPGEPGKFVSDL